MQPYYSDGAVTLYAGDCLDVLADLPDASIDAVVTDPPYGLEFMGKDWDAPWKYGFAAVGYTDGGDRLARPNFGSTRNPMCRVCRKHKRGTDRCVCAQPDFDEVPADASRLYQEWCQAWATECLRVLKPGGHLLAFGGTRTFHRLACAVEDAGFEIRDSITWIYGSGFPKSLDVSKAIDAAAGAEREVVGEKRSPDGVAYSALHGPRSGRRAGAMGEVVPVGRSTELLTAPATDDAKRWAGWGTALKPAHEPIVVARKPLAGTVAANVTAYGTGALNIDGCRVNPEPGRPLRVSDRTIGNEVYGDGLHGSRAVGTTDLGRWPTNVVLSHAESCVPDGSCAAGCPVADLDRQSGDVRSSGHVNRSDSRTARGELQFIAGGKGYAIPGVNTYADTGGASRFFPTFRYEPKAPTSERPRGDGVAHPTVKPLDLMRWLVRLVTPPGGLVLDPFAGSGTTGEACVVEGLRCVLVEREPDYLPLITARLSKPLQPVLELEVG